MLKTSKAFRWTMLGLLAVSFAILGPGVYRGLTDNREQTYEGLKLFSDVIDLVEKNYVDEVDPKKLIENAIQGMVSSLDPHSSLLTPEAFKEFGVLFDHVRFQRFNRNRFVCLEVEAIVDFANAALPDHMLQLEASVNHTWLVHERVPFYELFFVWLRV